MPANARVLGTFLLPRLCLNSPSFPSQQSGEIPACKPMLQTTSEGSQCVELLDLEVANEA